MTMKKIVKSLCIVLLLAFVFTASNHVNEVKAATKSEVTYKLKKGTLTISGKGDMPKKMTFERNGKIKKSRCVEQKIYKNGNKKPQFLKLWFLRKDGIMKN